LPRVRRLREPDRSPVVTPRTIEDALPLIRRALKVLSDREVSPQLGLLKSTLLQLDSTFSERDYGTSTFREFMQKMANAGYLNLKQVDRSVLVELKESDAPASTVASAAASATVPPNGHGGAPEGTPQQSGEGVRAMQDLFQNARTAPRWPMYLRNVKQFLRSADPSFDERRYGFASIHDLVRQAHREGFLRVERNRQGILRVFPGDRYAQGGIQPREERDEPEEPILEAVPVDVEPEIEAEPGDAEVAEPLELLPAPEPSYGSLDEPSYDDPPPPRREVDLAEEEDPPPPMIEPEKPKRRRRTSSTSGSARRKSTRRKPS
jgi:hypothetical protein